MVADWLPLLPKESGTGAAAGTGLPAAEAHAVVDRLRAVTPRGQTFSAGVAEWDGLQRPEELVHRADQALYRAKQQGRDRVAVAAS